MIPANADEWVDLLPSLDRHLPDSRSRAARVWEWSLVLAAMGIEHEVRSSRGTPRLLVPESRTARAIEEIGLYEQENAGRQESPDQAGGMGGFEPSLWAFLALAAFFKIVRLDAHFLGYRPVPWRELGSVDAGAVLSGEWWRTVTGLTLHGDLPHLLSNILIGGVFVIIASRELGSGLSWFLVVLSGALGNLCNAFIQGPPHDSIGFSTSVFGCVGIIAGLRIMESNEGTGPRRLLPVAAALGLLALLGTGGENTDLGAHLLGLACGFPLGVIASGFRPDRARPGSRINAYSGAAAAGLVLGAWACALLPPSPFFQLN